MDNIYGTILFSVILIVFSKYLKSKTTEKKTKDAQSVTFMFHVRYMKSLVSGIASSIEGGKALRQKLFVCLLYPMP